MGTKARSEDERIADVRRVLAAGRRLQGFVGALAPELVKTTRLSRAGVELAFAEHLEVDASDAELAALVRAAGHAERVTVVLSATVFVAALRAVALARAAAAEVVVRPSSHDPIFAKALAHELGELGDRAVRVETDLEVARVERGLIHLYGSDETVAALRELARVPLVGHGTGMGVAFVTGHDVTALARAVAADVVPFDQRGCLSPRVVAVRGDAERGRAFARALSEELAEREARVPRGELDDAERTGAARYRGTVTFAGELFDGPAHAVGFADELIVPPPGRHVHVIADNDDGRLVTTLAPVERYVAAVGVDAEEAAPTFAPRARRSALGLMQKPPLDGPVDRR